MNENDLIDKFSTLGKYDLSLHSAVSTSFLTGMLVGLTIGFFISMIILFYIYAVNSGP